MARPPRLVEALGLLAVVVPWGLNYLFVRAALVFAAPLWLAAFRSLLGWGTVAAVRVAFHRPGRLTGPGQRDASLLGLLTTTVFFGLWFTAAQSVAPGVASVLVYTFPLWVTLLAGPLLGDRVPRITGVGVAIGFAGVILVAEPWRAGSGGLPLGAVAELLVGALAWAAGTVLAARRFSPADLEAATEYQLLGGGAALALVALLAEPAGPVVASPALFVDLIWLGPIGTALAYSVWYVLLGRFPAPELSSYLFLVPVVALGASALALSERLDAVQLSGVVAVLACVYTVSRSRRGTATEPDVVPRPA